MSSLWERAATALVRRANGWANLYTAMGADPNDVGGNRTSYSYQASARLGPAMLDTLYHEDSFAARICEAVPKHALRRGFTVKVPNAPGVQTDINTALEDLGVAARFLEAWTWARVEGGGAVLLGADDGQPVESELSLDSLRGVRWLASLTTRELWTESWELDPEKARFGEPEVYRLQRTGGGGGSDSRAVHRSRVIRFEGLPTTRQRRNQLRGWGESVLQRAYPNLQEWNGAHVAVGALLQDASQGVLKFKDLMALMTSDPMGIMKRRLEIMDLGRSAMRSIILDSDGESFERTEVGALSGLPQILDRMSLRLSGASEIPVSILLGQAPAGMDATGEADMEAWRDAVSAERTKVLLPALTHITRLVFRSKDGPTKGAEPEGWTIELPPLREPSEEEKADTRLKTAQADDIYLRNGVTTPEEVAKSRFTAEGWSMETTVDLGARAPLEEPPANDNPTPTPVDPSLPADNGATPAGAEGEAPVVKPEEAKDPTTALNGAQIASLKDIVKDVAARLIPRETGVQLIVSSFPLDEAQAEKLMGEVGKTFFSGTTEAA